uniref:Uncharacterized protein n=1 Tax=Anguilla anguilla TaxID=7936 RepID=A0A0E9SDE4_ANGAN
MWFSLVSSLALSLFQQHFAGVLRLKSVAIGGMAFELLYFIHAQVTLCVRQCITMGKEPGL